MPTQKDKITLAEIFFPRAFAKFEAARNDKTRFVHYTNADAAMKILRSEKVWMRQSSCMNDFMEVIYGIECVTEALNAPCGEIFKSALNKAHTDVYDEINQNFEQRKLSLTTDTYLICISEHEEKEDDFGRLSMWRAYSDTTGVALVMNNTVFINESHTLGAYTSPVAYLNKEEFKTEFGEMVKGVQSNVDFIRNQNRETVKDFVFRMLAFAALSTKHPGFAEEKEWRVIYSPSLGHSTHIEKEICTIRGVPQSVYKIPLRDMPNDGLHGLALRSLFSNVIIGPTQYPVAVWSAFVEILAKAGMENPNEKVVVSNIPIRR